jgi:hypothetical protein
MLVRAPQEALGRSCSEIRWCGSRSPPAICRRERDITLSANRRLRHTNR